uniref:ATP synthase F0 subunit 8 n=1 Tax=Pyxicephalus adspersus TaxID=30357 RepID=A0AAV3AIE0_PYXAD|nr:TPA: hypothetical protein GDO54_007095 [Pyxicephalus adspersus]
MFINIFTSIQFIKMSNANLFWVFLLICGDIHSIQQWLLAPVIFFCVRSSFQPQKHKKTVVQSFVFNYKPSLVASRNTLD